MELFQYAAKVKLTHVPYKSAAEAVLALVGNQIQGVFDNPPTVLPHIRAGRLRALAYAAPKRFALLPDVPTFDESGMKGFEASSWFGLVAPANAAAGGHAAGEGKPRTSCAGPTAKRFTDPGDARRQLARNSARSSAPRRSAARRREAADIRLQ
jgi:hypothetical protein